MEVYSLEKLNQLADLEIRKQAAPVKRKSQLMHNKNLRFRGTNKPPELLVVDVLLVEAAGLNNVWYLQLMYMRMNKLSVLFPRSILCPCCIAAFVHTPRH